MDGGDEADCTEEVSGELIVACRYGPELLEFFEEALDRSEDKPLEKAAAIISATLFMAIVAPASSS